jgi:hypothetical protein
MAYSQSKIIALSAVCAFLTVAGVLFFAQTHKQTASPSVSKNAEAVVSTAPCSAPDQTFCSVQSLIIGYVEASDFSDILEHQVVTRVTCGTPTAPAGVCSGVSGSIPIDTFAVEESGISSYLTRNGYINYFQQYANEYGPFSFQGDSLKSNEINMAFKSSNTSKLLEFLCTQKNGTWHIALSISG